MVAHLLLQPHVPGCHASELVLSFFISQGALVLVQTFLLVVYLFFKVAVDISFVSWLLIYSLLAGVGFSGKSWGISSLYVSQRLRSLPQCHLHFRNISLTSRLFGMLGFHLSTVHGTPPQHGDIRDVRRDLAPGGHAAVPARICSPSLAGQLSCGCYGSNLVQGPFVRRPSRSTRSRRCGCLGSCTYSDLDSHQLVP